MDSDKEESVDKPLNLTIGTPGYFSVSQVPIRQEALWQGERCIVLTSSYSLLGSGMEEISFWMAEHIEQKKMRQEKDRLLLARRRQATVISKVYAKPGIYNNFRKYREDKNENTK